MTGIKKAKDKFYIGKKECPLAAIKFICEDNQIIIDHTFVSEQLKGQNIAKQLLRKVVEMARAENKKIIPICMFSQFEINKNKEYHDILCDVDYLPGMFKLKVES